MTITLADEISGAIRIRTRRAGSRIVVQAGVDTQVEILAKRAKVAAKNARQRASRKARGLRTSGGKPTPEQVRQYRATYRARYGAWIRKYQREWMRKRRAANPGPGVRRGESVAVAKLNPEKVLAMRAMRAAGASIQAVADGYGVSFAGAYKVLNRITWAHVQ